MKTLVIVRHAATRKDRQPGDTGSHLSRDGVHTARAFGWRLGEFDHVVVGPQPRHAETALAMGQPFSESVPWPSGYVPHVVDHHDQWSWQHPFCRYAELLRSSPRLAEVASQHLRHWRQVMDLVPTGGRALIVSSGGSIEPVLVAAVPDADHASWGGPFHQLEGAVLTWDAQAYRLAAILRRNTSDTRTPDVD